MLTALYTSVKIYIQQCPFVNILHEIEFLHISLQSPETCFVQTSADISSIAVLNIYIFLSSSGASSSCSGILATASTPPGSSCLLERHLVAL